MKPQIFISYRRETGRSIARNISDRLTSKGYNVFFDYTSMRNGKFNEQIYDAIEEINDFILILSKDSMDRCVNTDDWVRCEILHAIANEKNIILVQDEDFLGFPSFFPEELSSIKHIDFTPLSNKYYDAFIDMLENRLTSSNEVTNKVNTCLELDKTAIAAYKLGAYIYKYNFSLMLDSQENLLSSYEEICNLTNMLGIVNDFDNPQSTDLNEIKKKDWTNIIEDYGKIVTKICGAEFGYITKVGHHVIMIGTFCIYDLLNTNPMIQKSKQSIFDKYRAISKFISCPEDDINCLMQPIDSGTLANKLSDITQFYENYSQNVLVCKSCLKRNSEYIKNCVYCGATLK